MKMARKSAKFAFRRLYVYIIKLFDGLAKHFPRLTDPPQLAFRILKLTSHRCFSRIFLLPPSTPSFFFFLAISFILRNFFFFLRIHCMHFILENIPQTLIKWISRRNAFPRLWLAWEMCMESVGNREQWGIVVGIAKWKWKTRGWGINFIIIPMTGNHNEQVTQSRESRAFE